MKVKYMFNHQVMRFLIVGVMNTIVYYTLYSLFLFLGFDYKISVALATILGVLFNFKSFGKYVFYNDDTRLIFKFIGVYIVLFCLNLLLIKLFHILIENYYIAGFLAIFPCAVASFYLNREFVFKN
ncbi:GtrA family protein [Sulfurospirillum sp. 1612]|uniref:GtrA family protein n=1 Tax=Sulfurospirillum sp. 1612 TaxID=3094835 RepID=UPI003FCE9E84